MATKENKDDDKLELVDVTIKNEQGQDEKIQVPKDLAGEQQQAASDEQADDSRVDADVDNDAQEERQDAADQNLSAEQREERRRARKHRKLMQKRAKERSDATILALNKMVTDLSKEVAALKGNDMAQVRQSIQGALIASQRQLEGANIAMKTAMANGDNESFVAALQERDSAIASLNAAKQQAVAFNTTLERAKTQQRQAQAPANVAQQAMAQQYNAFIERNGFFDPEDEDDPITKKIDKIDEEVAALGFDPATPHYWAELQRRVDAEIKPNIGKLATEQQPQQKQPTGNGGGPKMTGGRTSTGKNTLDKHLTPARVQALKDLGVWEDPKKRGEYIQYYVNYDSQQSNAARR